MSLIKNFLAAMGTVLLLSAVTPALTFADNPANQITCGVNAAAGTDSCTANPNATKTINSTITNIINILSVVVGIIAVIMIIVAGFRYITSGGNDQTIATAKKTLTYAIIGLMIVALSQVISRFVLHETTKSVTTGATPPPSGSPSPSPSPSGNCGVPGSGC